MEIEKTKFKDAFVINPKVFGDNRGFFVESYSEQWFKNMGLDINFVQDNHSKSVEVGVLRGLHYQASPHAQSKLIRVTKGSVYDVIVDVRKNSETYGQWQGFELTEKNFKMLFVPKGFAHWFCTLEPDTEFMYKVDNLYNAESEGGIVWNDPTLNIDWKVKEPILSNKDTELVEFKNLKSPF